VASFLARRKGADSLAWKCLKSITIFGSDEILELSASICGYIDTSVALLFEVVDYNEQYLAEIQRAEALYKEGGYPATPTNPLGSNTAHANAG
jgi:hypothetical protein